MVNLWRAYYMMSEVLQFLMAGKVMHTTAYAVQSMKCMHQVALDKGDWGVTLHLLPTANPLEKAEFGGDEQELEFIHSYMKALRELKARGYQVPSVPNVKAEVVDASGGVADEKSQPNPKVRAQPKQKAKAGEKADAGKADGG